MSSPGIRPLSAEGANGRRVVVTGIGALTPIGHGRQRLWSGVMANRSAVRSVDRFDASPFPSQVAAQIDDFVPSDHLTHRQVKRLDRYSQLAVAAARMALADGRLQSARDGGERWGAFLGSALGGVAFGEEQHGRYLTGGLRAASPILATTMFGGAAASNVALELGIGGPTRSSSDSCAAGAMAIGQAVHAVRVGEIDVALAGGAEAPLAPLTFGAFARIGVLSSRNHDPARASRPFDVDRDGFVMAEGAAVLLLEAATHAARRGAPIIAEVCGFGSSNDAFHITTPSPDGAGMARALRNALADAGLPPVSVDYVNAHASGTRLNEPAEAAALATVFGAGLGTVLVSGTKGLYGHALGASGAIEAAVTALAIKSETLPGTCNLEHLDPAIGLCVLREPLRRRIEVAVSTSAGFGGINAALALRQANI